VVDREAIFYALAAKQPTYEAEGPAEQQSVVFRSSPTTSPSHGLMGLSVAWERSNARNVRHFRQAS
jgi:hypothetical protein